MDIIAYDPDSPSRLTESSAVDPASFAALSDEEAIPALLAALKLPESEGAIESVRHMHICDECATGGAALFSSVLRAG